MDINLSNATTFVLCNYFLVAWDKKIALEKKVELNKSLISIFLLMMVGLCPCTAPLLFGGRSCFLFQSTHFPNAEMDEMS
jgi:hypothetical protein